MANMWQMHNRSIAGFLYFYVRCLSLRRCQCQINLLCSHFCSSLNCSDFGRLALLSILQYRCSLVSRHYLDRCQCWEWSRPEWWIMLRRRGASFQQQYYCWAASVNLDLLSLDYHGHLPGRTSVICHRQVLHQNRNLLKFLHVFQAPPTAQLLLYSSESVYSTGDSYLIADLQMVVPFQELT